MSVTAAVNPDLGCTTEHCELKAAFGVRCRPCEDRLERLWMIEDYQNAERRMAALREMAQERRRRGLPITGEGAVPKRLPNDEDRCPALRVDGQRCVAAKALGEARCRHHGTAEESARAAERLAYEATMRAELRRRLAADEIGPFAQPFP